MSHPYSCKTLVNNWAEERFCPLPPSYGDPTSRAQRPCEIELSTLSRIARCKTRSTRGTIPDRGEVERKTRWVVVLHSFRV